MKVYYEHNAPAEERTLIKVERNALNPLPGLTFVSISYWRNQAGEIYAIVF